MNNNEVEIFWSRKFCETPYNEETGIWGEENINEWLYNNIEKDNYYIAIGFTNLYKNYITRNRTIYVFENSNDAMYFKLRWEE